MSVQDKVIEVFLRGVHDFRPDINRIYDNAHGHTLPEWKTLQKSLVTGSGVLSAAIPVFHFATMAADVAFIINRMGVASLGVGAIQCRDHGLGNLLEDEDFEAILGYWGDCDGVKTAMRVKGKAAGKIVTKGVTKAVLQKSGYMTGNKIAGKAAGKIGSKFAAKFAGKMGGGFVPIAGPAISGAVNLWLISSMIKASSSFYQDKIDLVAHL